MRRGLIHSPPYQVLENSMSIKACLSMWLKMTSVVAVEIKRFQHLNKAGSGLIVVVIWMPCGPFKHCFISAVATLSHHHYKITLPPKKSLWWTAPAHQISTSNLCPLEGKENESSVQFPNSQIGPDSPLCAPDHFAPCVLYLKWLLTPHTPIVSSASFLATLAALHFTPVSDTFWTSLASRLASML